jgi:hypothetical protein
LSADVFCRGNAIGYSTSYGIRAGKRIQVIEISDISKLVINYGITSENNHDKR